MIPFVDECVGQIRSTIVNSAISAVAEQVGYVLNYSTNFNDLQNQVTQLQEKAQGTRTSVEDAERIHGMKRQDYVEKWLNEVNAFTEKAENHIKNPERVRARLVCHPWSCECTNLKLRRKLSKEAKDMVADAVDRMKIREGFTSLTFQPRTDYLGGTSYFDGEANIFESRKKKMEEIMEALRDPKIRKIGIYGLEGVGKATVARQVGRRAKHEKLFNVVTEAKVGESRDKDKIQQCIAELLDMKLDDKSVGKRAISIRKAIEREKPVLVILGDVCDVIKLEDYGIPDPSNKNIGDGDNVETTTFLGSEGGKKFATSNPDSVVCKILMTSRSEERLLEMGSEKNFALQPLEPEEACIMFKDKAGLNVQGKDNDDEWQKIAEKIARKCEGLPALITTMATTLKPKSIEHWKHALTDLGADSTTATEMHKIVHSSLKLCYSWLESEVQTLFLLCGMKEYTNIDDLVKYVLGLGIFHNAKTVEDARNSLGGIINSLKASCLLLDDSTMEYVTMSNMVRGVSISIASKDHHHFVRKSEEGDLKEWPSDDFLQSCPLISLYVHCNNILPERPHCPKLEFFCLSTPFITPSNIIPRSFFEGMLSLKVLDLTHMVMPSLPTSLVSLTQLRTLCLDSCNVEDMSGIGSLGNLEILSLLYFPMNHLPSEIGKLTNLRLLDLSRSKIEAIPPNVISKLVKLEEFYTRKCSIKWALENTPEQKKIASLSEFRHLKNLTALEIHIQDPAMLPNDLNFQNLERYKILVGKFESWDWFDKHKVSKTLKLNLGLEHKHGLKRWLMALFKKVENLYMGEIKNSISNIVYELNAKGFPALKHLHVHNNSTIQYLVDNSTRRSKVHAFFPNLETLSLDNLSSLKNICNGPLLENSFNKLRVIKVKNCGKLQYLIPVSMVKVISQLVQIKVSDCNSIQSIISSEPQVRDTSTGNKIIKFASMQSLTLKNLPKLDHFYSDDISTSFFSAKLEFPNMETLKLSSMNLNKIWDDQTCDVAFSVGKLAYLIVEDCGSLKYLFSSFLVQSLSNLKELDIQKCDMMEEIIATCGVARPEVKFPKLKEVRIRDMKSLKAVWYYQFDGVKTLEVHNCERVEKFFPCHIHTTFLSLEILEISECKSLQVIFEMSGINGGNSTAHLEELRLDKLPKLKKIWSEEHGTTTHFSNLQFIGVASCKDLAYLFPSTIAMDVQLQVQVITLRGANKMVEIVDSKKQGPKDITPTFRFEQLTFLELWELPQLKTFYAGNHNLSFASLKELDVYNCSNLKLFEMQYMSGQPNIFYDKLDTSVQHQEPLFKADEVIPNLELLRISDDRAGTLRYSYPEPYWRRNFGVPKTLKVSEFLSEEVVFPNWLLQYLIEGLEILTVKHSSFKKIFQKKRENIITSASLKTLKLKSLSQLEYICEEGSQLDPILEVLERLYVNECPRLTHLVPSSATFGYLKDMEVCNCNGLINLFASSTAINLVRLTIRQCNELQLIVTEAANETKDEVAFQALETLELEYLPSLISFCSSKFILKFPSLEKVIVKQCPRIKVLSKEKASAPKLQEVQVDDKSIWKSEEQDQGKVDIDLNDIFQHEAVEKEDEGRVKESSSKTPSSEENNAEKTKVDQIVNIGKQETQMQKDKSEDAGSSMGSPESHDGKTGLDEKMFNETTISVTTNEGEGPTPPPAPKAKGSSPPPSLAPQGPEAETKAYTSHKGMFDTVEKKNGGKIEASSSKISNSEEDKTVEIEEHATSRDLLPEIHSAQTKYEGTESHNGKTIPDEKMFNQTTISVTTEGKETKGPSPLPPAPQGPEAETKAYTNYKGMFDISVENLAYLMGGLKRHPQVLEWLNTKPQRVFASSMFSLFAEVTRLMRTTKRGYLSQNDKNYIIQCCKCLESAGFDASWICYVRNCIEECGNNGENEMLKKKLQESEAKACDLRAQLEFTAKDLASLEVSLALLRQKATKLEDFIES